MTKSKEALKGRKKANRPQAKAQGKNYGKTEGDPHVILDEINAADKWKKPKAVVEKVFSLGDQIF